MKETKTIESKINANTPSILSDRAVLVILSSNFLGKTFVVDKEKSVIGRESDCDIVINDQTISKNHCAVIYENEKFYIEDLESMNSTFVNGKKIKKRTHLIYGDRIVIGKTIIRFYLEEKIG